MSLNDPHAEPDEQRYDAELMRRLLGYLRPYRWLAGLAVLLLLGTAALTLVGPALTQRALDVAVPARDNRAAAQAGVAVARLLVLEFCLDYAQAYLTSWMGQAGDGGISGCSSSAICSGCRSPISTVTPWAG